MSSVTKEAGPGQLFIIGTPIGNLSDLSPRARSVLSAVSLIAAEDTRVSALLIRDLAIKPRLVALHHHNEQAATAHLLRALKSGRDVAVVSDAGTPGVSDPGALVVAAAHAAEIRVVPVPGPSAVLTAFSASGFAGTTFRFNGFLPSKRTARRQAIEAFRSDSAIQIMFEAPHRIVDCVADLSAVLEPTRQLLIARELTKIFETIRRLPLAQAAAWFSADPNQQRGEFVLVLEGAPTDKIDYQENTRILALLLAELPLKQAVQLASKITGASRKVLYAEALLSKGPRSSVENHWR